MNWVDRINHYIMKRIIKHHGRARLASGKDVLRLSPVIIDQLVRLELTSNDEFIGETMILLGSVADGRLVTINESDPGWAAVCEALDQSGQLSVTMDEAKLKLIADTQRRSQRLLG